MYASPEDLKAMVRLLETARDVERISDFPSIVDLHEAMSMERIRTLPQNPG